MRDYEEPVVTDGLEVVEHVRRVEREALEERVQLDALESKPGDLREVRGAVGVAGVDGRDRNHCLGGRLAEVATPYGLRPFEDRPVLRRFGGDLAEKRLVESMCLQLRDERCEPAVVLGVVFGGHRGHDGLKRLRGDFVREGMGVHVDAHGRRSSRELSSAR